ncbi:MAG: hypothetical protein ACFFDJ_09170 [Candidatus Odinarchaeota archaeon]
MFKKLIFFGLTILLLLSSIPLSLFVGVGAQGTTASDLVIWANEGGDKVTQDELRATNNPNSVLNSVWDGNGISLFGARNEVVSFNLVIEAPHSTLTGIDVTISSLTGPGGSSISSRSASGDDVFNFVGRNIELFYVKYLKIEGLSTDLFFAGYDYDERHIPERFRRPYDQYGEGTGGWEDRPDHDKYYPDIAVPLELNSPFSVIGGSCQSIWGDIYIPKTAPSGNYTGNISVKKDGTVYQEVPITLNVRNFALPDIPNAKTMVDLDYEGIGDRYLSVTYPEPDTEAYKKLIDLANVHFQLAHRHKISLFDSYTPVDQMDEAWVSRLSGELFTPAHGYEGVGVGVGNNIYVIGAYDSWPWQSGTQSDMWTNTDAWVNWFDSQSFTTPTEYFLYLIDESDDYPEIEQWAQWIDNNPGPGQRLKSFATIDLPTAVTETPALDIVASWYEPDITSVWENALEDHKTKPETKFYMYNGKRPGSGSFATEDDGVALRELAWGQYKMGIDRWFYWTSTYYDDYQSGEGATNVFQQARTFGSFDQIDNVFGKTGWNYLNGDGVLFYPGTDTRFSGDSYGVMGPFASLRLKYWRRGIQDVDYLTLAAEINPTRTAEIVNSMIPEVLWEYGVDDPEDPTFVYTDISWSTDPDVWEEARRELAAIIEGTEYEPIVPDEPEEPEEPEEPIEPEEPEESTETFALTSEIALIAAVAVAAVLGIVAFWALRKRTKKT